MVIVMNLLFDQARSQYSSVVLRVVTLVRLLG